jgi:signal transduction histidine kinase/integral membrane sensor domain MASE1
VSVFPYPGSLARARMLNYDDASRSMPIASAVGALRRRLTEPPGHTVAIALLIATGYYAGSRVGFVLTFPPVTPSLMWPPNAILTAALLLSSPKRWWICLVAALPAHLAAQVPHSLPATLIVLLFATNCSEALIAALLVRRFAPGGRITFDSLRSAGTFIVCVGLAAPFFSSFLDAAAVALVRGEQYDIVWRTRFFANTLTELTLVPPLMMAFAPHLAWTRRLLRRRWAELLALCAALIAIGVLFGTSRVVGGVAASPMIVVALVLPFTTWAAVRLGPGGTSVTMLTIELIAITAGMRAGGPFGHTTIVEVLSLQIVLMALTIPLMCVTALVAQQELTRRTLEDRLRFEEMLSGLSRAFVHLPSDEIDRVMDDRLQELGEYLGVDHITIYEFSHGQEAFLPTHAWAAPVRSLREASSLSTSWVELTELPTLVTDACVVRFGPLASGQPWPPEVVSQLRLVAEVFANVIARKKAEDALRASEIMNTAILASLHNGVAVLNRDGRVVAINDAWRRFSQSGQTDGGEAIGVGATVEALCRYAVPSPTLFAEVKDGLQSVIDGKSTEFSLEYPRAASAGERWFAMAVLPLHREEGGAVVSFTDVTERRRVELDAQQTRQELAHFTRVSTIGELTASLAHELNQPLTGILANARAAQRFLAVLPSPDLAQVRECLVDVVADNHRASDVIRRLRELLRKGKVRPVLLDLNVLVGDVVKLLSSDAIMRDVSITVDLEPGLPLVKADRVQLQQVILNLLVNAMEAVTASDTSERSVIVHTTLDDALTVHMAVEDTGPGLEPGTETTIFEPFYTSKPEGMGMGLSIARSIVAAHGGRIWAISKPSGGTTFHVTVPVTYEDA